jgi:hypothetical protein
MVLKMEAEFSSETSGNLYHVTRRRFPVGRLIISSVRTTNPMKFGRVPKFGAENTCRDLIGRNGTVEKIT